MPGKSFTTSPAAASPSFSHRFACSSPWTVACGVLR
jgi:hypothetical protein